MLSMTSKNAVKKHKWKKNAGKRIYRILAGLPTLIIGRNCPSIIVINRRGIELCISTFL